MKHKSPYKHLKIIEVPILNDEYWVYVTIGKKKDAEACLKKHFEDNYISIGDRFRGRCFNREGYHPMIYMYITPKDKHFFSTLSHEAVHAVNFIWDYIGEREKNEAFAHSISAIVYKVAKEIL